MQDLVIVGAGGFGREVAWLVEEINEADATWNLMGFIDNQKSEGSIINGYPVLGDESWFINHKEANAVIAIGDPIVRQKIASRLALHSVSFASLIHPEISIHSTVSVGLGSILCRGTIVTVNVDIGSHVIINLDSTIGHDAILNDFVTIFPSCNISGFVRIGSHSLLGTGTQIIQELNVGENVYIGAGAVVNRDIPNNSVAVGVPARVIKKREFV